MNNCFSELVIFLSLIVFVLLSQLLMDTGIISLRSNGMFALLPLGERVMMKLTKLIDKEMSCIGAQRLSLPLLTSGELWKKTGK